MVTTAQYVNDMQAVVRTVNDLSHRVRELEAVELPLGGGVPAHTILDASVHTDTALDAVSRGSLIYGNATPLWDELVHPGKANHVLISDANDVLWSVHTIDISGDSEIAGTFIGGGTVDTATFTGTIPVTGTFAMGAGTVTSITTNDTTLANHTHALDNTGVVAAVYGSATQVPQLTVDAKGRLTLVANVLITGVTPAAHAPSHEVGGSDLVNHDNLTGFVANEHINHTAVTITAGAGLTGGGDISASRTLDVGAGNGITVNANDVALTTPGTITVVTPNSAVGNHTHAITTSNDGTVNPSTIVAFNASGQITASDYFTDNSGTVGIDGDVRIRFNSANGFIDAWLDDNAGADEFRVIDSDGIFVSSIDSDGNAFFNGTGNFLDDLNTGGDFQATGSGTFFDNVYLQNGKYIGISSDVRILFDSTNGYINAILGDTAGSDRVRILDSGLNQVAYINSDGDGFFVGDVTCNNLVINDYILHQGEIGNDTYIRLQEDQITLVVGTDTYIDIKDDEIDVVCGTTAMMSIIEGAADYIDIYTDVRIANQKYIGIDSSDVRIEFDSTSGYIDAILGDAAGSDEFRVVDSGLVAVATIDSDGMLDSICGNINILIGADLGTNTRTNLTAKHGRIANYHYTNAEKPFALAYCFSDSTRNLAIFGGGTSQLNAATEIRFYTAANTTTATGTQRAMIDSAGFFGLGTTSPAYRLDIDAGAMRYAERSDPSAPAANSVVVYARDNGSGKTQLCARFATGAIQVLATEP